MPSRKHGRLQQFDIECLERRDCPAVVAISGDQTLSEAGSPVVLTVSLAAPDRKPVVVGYSISGDAAAGRDYRLAAAGRSLAVPAGALTFRPGETRKVITVTPVNDPLREPTERFTMSFSPLRNAHLTNSSTTVTLLDNDDYTASIVGPASVVPGTPAEFTVRLSAPATKTEVIHVSTQAGSASDITDFRPLTRLPLVFNPGDTSRSFRVPVLANTDTETDESFFIRLMPTSGGFPRIDPFRVLIPGNGPAPPPQMTIANVTVTEGNAGKKAIGFTIFLSERYDLPVTVRYATANGTATTADSDYEPVEGVATIDPGATTAVVQLNIVGDTRVEPDETFTLVLSAPVNATLTKATGVVTIVTDDIDPGSSFQIIVTFPNNSLTATQKQVFQLAADRWSQLIMGDLPDVAYQGRTIDDVEITATAPFIDGPYGELGRAGPRQLRQTGSRLPYTGIMQFDSADLAMMETDGLLFGVILHEMGHVLGLGTLWGQKNLITAPGTSDPRYTGANAVREYRQLAGDQTAPSIPVENTGGPGTADGHWREEVFGTELMTGFAERRGVAMPISRMTIGALEDLGYTVNYAAADPYVFPARMTSPVQMFAGGETAPRPTDLTSLPPHFFAALSTSVVTEALATARTRAFARFAVR